VTTFQQYQHNRTTVLRPEGKLNMVAAPQLRQHIANAVGNGQTRLVIDLSATEFIDSSGLGALVAGLKAARQAGGDLRIACPGEQALLVLDLTSMTSVLHPYASVDDASQ
jgi:anti-sigma B factor antagonist